MTNFRTKGFTLIEFLLSVSIAIVVGFVVSTFMKDIIGLGSKAQSNMTAVLESRKILSVIVSELRSTIPSALGSYAIETAATSSVTFFADVNSDDIADRVRYFLDPPTKSIKRGVILASGTPPAYTLPETFSTLISGVSNSTSTPIFNYYDAAYDGTTNPLTFPINITSVRLIKVTVWVNDPKGTDPVIMTSQAMLRNLKD